jgi:hypothetical protein
MFFAGHDHHYERTDLIYGRSSVSQEDEVNITETPGTIYFVTGGGGAPLYNCSSEWWTNVSNRIYHYCVINATPSRLELVAKDRNGTIIDAVTMLQNSGPFTTLSVPNGGEKWEQSCTYTITWSDNIDENVKIELFKGGTLNSTIANSTESDGEYDWEIPEDQEIGNDYKVKVTSIISDTVFGQSSANFSIGPEFILSIPYVQNFDTLNTGEVLPEKWEQLSSDDFNWKVWTGSTPSSETGADGDHTSGSGNYIYTEASSPNNPSKKADFLTPKFDISSVINLELTFWSHMYSNQNEMGDLYLDVEIDGAWNNDVVHLSDDHGQQWFVTTEDLSSYTGDRMRLRFRGVTGAGSKSDICVDDIRVSGEIVTISMNNKSFNSSAVLKSHGSIIQYVIPDNNQKVSIILYDLKGKLVRTLVDGFPGSATNYIDLNKGKLSAGIYLCRMKSAGVNKTITVMVKK